MNQQGTLLKDLLVRQHRQKYETFCQEYDRAASTLGEDLRGTQPSRAQYYRWLSGQLKGGLPYPDACRVLEAMFPDWTAADLFSGKREMPKGTPDTAGELNPREQEAEQLSEIVELSLGQTITDVASPEWGADRAEVMRHRPPASSRDIPASLSSDTASIPKGTSRDITHRLLALQQIERLSGAEVYQLAALSGQIVDLEYRLEIDIANDGWATLRAHQHLINLTDAPVARFVRDFWFEHTDSTPTMLPLPVDDGRQVAIQRIHDTPSFTKFACQLSPPVGPGETATIRCSCSGGRFVSDHYWRQSFNRFTRRFTLALRHRGVRPLVQCSATEEFSNGSEVSTTEDLVWDYQGDDVMLTLTRDYLRPNQAVTLRWEVTHDDSA